MAGILSRPQYVNIVAVDDPAMQGPMKSTALLST